MLVSLSVVFNYFFILCVVEYNISGFEDVRIWEDFFLFSLVVDINIYNFIEIVEELY